MTRKKVQLAFIIKDAKRRSTLVKRSQGLVKKSAELGTLCDVETSVIVYGPHDWEMVAMWPPTKEEVTPIVERFKSLPETSRAKKVTTQRDFLDQRIGKLDAQVRQQQIENKVLAQTVMMYEALSSGSFNGASLESWIELDCVAERVLKELHSKLEVARAREAAAATKEAAERAAAADSMVTDMTMLSQPPLLQLQGIENNPPVDIAAMLSQANPSVDMAMMLLPQLQANNPGVDVTAMLPQLLGANNPSMEMAAAAAVMMLPPMPLPQGNNNPLEGNMAFPLQQLQGITGCGGHPYPLMGGATMGPPPPSVMEGPSTHTLTSTNLQGVDAVIPQPQPQPQPPPPPPQPPVFRPEHLFYGHSPDDHQNYLEGDNSNSNNPRGW